MVAVILALDVVYLTFVTAFNSSRLAVDTLLLQQSVSAASGMKCLYGVCSVAVLHTLVPLK